MNKSNAVEKALWAQRRRAPLTIALRALFALILAFITILAIQTGFDQLSGPERYRIVVAGESGGAPTLRATLMNECGANSVEGESPEWQLDGRPVEFDDQHHIASDARLTAEAVAARDDTLMVIGHFNSTASSQTLPVYLAQSPPVPVMLTVETNPKLTEFGEAENPPVVRMWPNDEDQAAEAVRLALQQGNNFWVVRDTSANPVYSNYLADEFTKRVLREGKRVTLRSDIRDLPSPQTLREYDIDVVFFPGGWEDALMLVHTVDDTWGMDPHLATPKVLLTDAAADEEHRLGVVGGREVAGIFITHPASAKTYMSKQVQVELARDACKRVGQLLRLTEKRIHQQKPRLLLVLNHHSLRYARKALGEAAAAAPAPNKSFYFWRAGWQRDEGAIAFEDWEQPAGVVSRSAPTLLPEKS